MTIHRNRPIGVFDSGLGGLTVVNELVRQLPQEDIVYFGDTARVPYGSKSKSSIIQFSKENSEILLAHNVKMIIVACNSSSSYAIPHLRKEFDLPILGVINPGAKKGVAVTKNNRIGIIATTATIQSRAYNKAIVRQKKSVEVYSQACPLFVPLVECGWFHKKATELIAQEYLFSLKKEKVDTLVLGCTHYPLLRSLIKKVMGAGVSLVDSAQEVAAEVQQLLRSHALERKTKKDGTLRIFISDEPQEFEKIAKRFLNKKLTVQCKLYKK